MITIAARTLRKFLVMLSLVPFTASAQFPTMGMDPALMPALPSIADIAEFQLAHQTWSSADGRDWFIKSEGPTKISIYLSHDACERWIAQGKRTELASLQINGEPLQSAKCRNGINQAEHPPVNLGAKAFEAALFGGLLD